MYQEFTIKIHSTCAYILRGKVVKAYIYKDDHTYAAVVEGWWMGSFKSMDEALTAAKKRVR